MNSATLYEDQEVASLRWVLRAFHEDYHVLNTGENEWCIKIRGLTIHASPSSNGGWTKGRFRCLAKAFQITLRETDNTDISTSRQNRKGPV